MSVQTSVSTNFNIAYPGDPRGSDYAENERVAQVAINPGLFCCQGSADGKCKLPTSSAEVAKGLGIARSNVASDPNFPSAGATYPIGDTVPLIYRGQVWVQVEESVAPMDPVYVRYDTGTGSQKGAFRKSADSSTAAAVTGARYLTTAAADGYALVDLNSPQ